MTAPGALPTRKEIVEILGPHLGAGSSSPDVIADALLARLRLALEQSRYIVIDGVNHNLADLPMEFSQLFGLANRYEQERDALRADLQRAREQAERWKLVAETKGSMHEASTCTHAIEANRLREANDAFRADLDEVGRRHAADKLDTIAILAENQTLRVDLAAVSLRAQEWEIKWAHADADLRACAEALETILPAMDTILRWIESHKRDLKELTEADFDGFRDSVNDAHAALARPSVVEHLK